MSAHLKPQNQKNNGFLGWIEKVGNKMPDVVTIFLSLSILIIVLSFIGETLGWSAVHPGSGEIIKVFNLASSEGLRKIVSEFNNNISSFGPLYFGIVIMLGIGLLEGSGLASAMLRKFVIHIPAKYITFVVLLLGVNASIASDAGYIILPPIAGLMFYAVGRNPIAGMLCGYAASACGHGAAFVITIVDVVTLGFSENAAQILNPGFKLTLLDNYYFILVSSIILPIAAYFTTEKVVIPRAVNLAYRIGDSVTNSITPMMAYFVLLLGYVQQWDKKAGLGTLMANLLPL